MDIYKKLNRLKKHIKFTDTINSKVINKSGKLRCFFMKIYNNPNINKIMQIYNKSNIKKSNKTDTTNEVKDELQLSSKALEFQAAMKAFKNLPEIREDLVKDLRDKIQQGTYNVTGEEIADKIVESALVDKKV